MEGSLPSLVEVNEKDDVVSKAGQPVGRRHGDDEGEHVVDEGVKSLTTKDTRCERGAGTNDRLFCIR